MLQTTINTYSDLTRSLQHMSSGETREPNEGVDKPKNRDDDEPPVQKTPDPNRIVFPSGRSPSLPEGPAR